MRIAFWSPVHGTGATANLMALMLAISEECGRSILLTQTHFNLNDLEGPLTSDLEGADGDDYFFNMGIDAVIKYFKAGMLSKEILDGCATDITDRISLLSGTRQSSRTAYDNRTVNSIVEHVICASAEFYDWVVTDINAGMAEPGASLLKSADVVVVNLRQNRGMIDSLFESGMPGEVDPDRIFYLFGSYDPDSKYNLSNLKHIFGAIESSNSAGIPHSTGYMDALSEKRAVDYIRAGIRDPDIDRYFFDSLAEAGKKLVAMTAKAGRRA